jgi:hypothetical protein
VIKRRVFEGVETLFLKSFRESLEYQKIILFFFSVVAVSAGFEVGVPSVSGPFIVAVEAACAAAVSGDCSGEQAFFFGCFVALDTCDE